MPPSVKNPSTKKKRQRAKRERNALRMLRKSVEQQVRLAFAKVPKESAALSQIRLDIRETLVGRGYLTVEELESLTRKEATTKALTCLTEQLRREPEE